MCTLLCLYDRLAEPDLRRGADLTKLVEMQGLGLYCDMKTNPVMLGDGVLMLGDGVDFAKRMKHMITEDHSYIMEVSVLYTIHYTLYNIRHLPYTIHYPLYTIHSYTRTPFTLQATSR
jgi:hypothetical protein